MEMLKELWNQLYFIFKYCSEKFTLFQWSMVSPGGKEPAGTNNMKGSAKFKEEAFTEVRKGTFIFGRRGSFKSPNSNNDREGYLNDTSHLIDC